MLLEDKLIVTDDKTCDIDGRAGDLISVFY